MAAKLLETLSYDLKLLKLKTWNHWYTFPSKSYHLRRQETRKMRDK